MLPSFARTAACAWLAMFCAVSSAQAAGAPPQQDLTLPTLSLPGTDLGEGDPANLFVSLQGSPGTLVDWVSYQLTITVFPGNGAADAALFALGSAAEPYVATLVPLWQHGMQTGTFTVSRSFSLAATAQSFTLGSDGLLNLEIYDFADDVIGGPDSVITSGSIDFAGVGRMQIGVVPEPAGLALMSLGLLALAGRVYRQPARNTVR